MPDRVGRSRPVTVVAVVAVAVLALVGTLLAVTGRDPDPADLFVTRSGATLRVGGEEFRFVGFNLYDAAASDIYSCSPATRLDDAELDEAMQSVRDAGGTVVRFWAFQTYTAGGTDYSGVDRVVRAARAHGLRVMPVLEDGPGSCSTGTPRLHLDRTDGDTWYSDGYREPLGTARTSYRDYTAAIARHYRDEPTILAWSLVNEAETSGRNSAGRSVLVDFARDVSAVVRAADPNHLITLGTQGNGAAGASGPDFADIYALPGLDVTEVHDWGHWGSDVEPMPGAAADGSLPPPDQCQALDADIACSFAAARSLGKPLIVGEAGIRAVDSAERARRAELLGAKLDAAFEAGASGYLVWQLNTANTDDYGVVVGEPDPLFTVMREAADRWATMP